MTIFGVFQNVNVLVGPIIMEYIYVNHQSFLCFASLLMAQVVIGLEVLLHQNGVQVGEIECMCMASPLIALPSASRKAPVVLRF